MTKLDRNLLQQVKRGFVPMPGGQGEPVAGFSPMTSGMTNPMGGDPSQGGGMPPVDPNTGMPMDPSMMGGAPGGMPPGGDPSQGGGMPPGGDPSQGGGMPPAPDPSMGGGMPPAPPSGSMISLTMPDLIELIKTLKGDGPGGEPKKAGGKAGVEAKLDQILQMMGGAPAPAPAPAPQGGGSQKV